LRLSLLKGIPARLACILFLFRILRLTDFAFRCALSLRNFSNEAELSKNISACAITRRIDADLDADIPEADEGGYEHTDTEAELSTSDDESVDAGRLPQQFVATSMVRSDGTQNSMDLSGLVSTASSQIGSSPRQGLRASLRGRLWESPRNRQQ